ncbi:MAG: hypothetical protein AXA67_09390 [Methylothermaceae bacteria B42]|nr:MAG: hypothetical protein AXA67_09390 [Methylothermaceae bacteria B42]HHJ39519.1 2Fe-2S iron-sulfur cluster binding domain-containing protein [Methylothermaceae bacterium]
MPRLIVDNLVLTLEEGESVLDCLLRHDIEVSFGCQAGICQSCLLRSVEEVPEEAQKGLNDPLRVQNYFLACQYQPQNDVWIQLPDTGNFEVEVESLEHLTPEVMRLRLSKPQDYEYRAGQFLNLFHEGKSRSYSLASLSSDPFLELHIRRVPKGLFSHWIFERLALGSRIEIGPANGNCFYTPGQFNQPLLLIGTGTGLAPLYGVLRDALSQGHLGPIYLYHGSSTPEGLYLQEILSKLQGKHPHFHYVPCLSRGPAMEGIKSGRADEIALSEHPDLKSWRVYLCGNPEMVKSAQKKCYLAGARLQEIFSDPFLPAQP